MAVVADAGKKAEEKDRRQTNKRKTKQETGEERKQTYLRKANLSGHLPAERDVQAKVGKSRKPMHRKEMSIPPTL